MAHQQAPASPFDADNDNDVELIDRLRSTALGGEGDAKSRRSAQLAFDPDIDLEKRMRHIAGLTDPDSSLMRAKPTGKKGFGWLPIPLGILAVISLGAALTRNMAKSAEEEAPPDDAPPANLEVAAPPSPQEIPGAPDPSGQMKEVVPAPSRRPGLRGE